MNGKLTLVASVAVLSLCSMACDNTASGSTPSASAASDAKGGAPGASAKPAEPQCAAGEWAEPRGKLCIKLPAGWTAGDIRESDVAGYKQTDMTFKVPDGGGPNWASGSFYYRDAGKGDYEAGLTAPKLDAEQGQKDGAGKGMEQEGDVAKGTGKFFIYRDVNKSHRCYVHLLRGETHVVVSLGAKELDQALIDACKSAYMP